MAPRREVRIAAGLCALAALRVFLFSAAFPFFNNVDETNHFDLIVKYARAHVPGGLELRDATTSRAVALYDSPEYFFRPGANVRTTVPRFRLGQTAVEQRYLDQIAEASAQRKNHESTQPPLYYALAGAWYRLGEGLGLSGGTGARRRSSGPGSALLERHRAPAWWCVR